MLLATESRGELIENRHEGCVAVVGEDGLRNRGGRWAALGRIKDRRGG